MNGWCFACRGEGLVWRFRLFTVGLIHCHTVCAERYAAMGVPLEAVTEADPREGNDRRSTDRGNDRRAIRAGAVRAGLRWLRAAA